MRIIFTNARRWFVLIIVVISSFMSVLDSTIMNVVMPTITTYFKDGINKSEWLISGYTLSMSIMILCSGWFARRYGFKRVYIIGIVIFTLASFMCSIASSMNYLIAMRMVQGIGSGIITPLSMSIIAHNFTGKERDLAIGFWIMAIGLSSAAGPFLGGYLVETNSWDWVFKINIPIGVFLTIIALIVMKDYREKVSVKFDYIGVALLLIWAPLSLYILSSNFEWQLIVILIVIFGLFVLRMIYARNPLINVNIFRNRNFVLAFILMLCLGLVLFGGNFITSQYLLHGLHYSAYEVGIILIPTGIIQGVIAPITGSLTHRYGNRAFVLAGLFIILTYLYLSSEIVLDSPHWYILLTVSLRGLGIGLSLTALTSLSLSGVKNTEIDSISGVINMIKQLAGSLSVAIVTIVILNNSNSSAATNPQEYVIANNESFTLLSVIIIAAIIAVFSIKERHKVI